MTVKPVSQDVRQPSLCTLEHILVWNKRNGDLGFKSHLVQYRELTGEYPFYKRVSSNFLKSWGHTLATWTDAGMVTDWGEGGDMEK